MDSNINVTFGEGSEVKRSQQASELQAMIRALKNRITSLENELQQVKGEVKKLEQSGQLFPEELVDHKY